MDTPDRQGCCLVTKSRLTLCDLMVCSPPDSSVNGIFQATILEWVAISFPREYPLPGIQPSSPVWVDGFFTLEAPGKPEKQGARGKETVMNCKWRRKGRERVRERERKSSHYSQ